MPAAPSQLEPHHSRTRILDASLHLFRAQGYAATTIDDICRTAGLTKGSFFHHFKGKQELAIAASDHFAQLAGSLFRTAPYHHHADPLDRVLGYIDFRAAILQGELPQYTCLLGTMVQETYDSHPALREACERHITDHALELVGDISLAKDLYAPGASWTSGSLAVYSQAVLQGAFVLAKASHGPQVAVECISHLRRYVQFLMPRPYSKELRA